MPSLLYRRQACLTWWSAYSMPQHAAAAIGGHLVAPAEKTAILRGQDETKDHTVAFETDHRRT